VVVVEEPLVLVEVPQLLLLSSSSSSVLTLQASLDAELIPELMPELLLHEANVEAIFDSIALKPEVTDSSSSHPMTVSALNTSASGRSSARIDLPEQAQGLNCFESIRTMLVVRFRKMIPQHTCSRCQKVKSKKVLSLNSSCHPAPRF
jgi:hypothetical protein